MSAIPKEVLRDMIKEENLKTSDDLHSFLKDMFKDAIQEMLEVELDMELGYDKRERERTTRLKIVGTDTHQKISRQSLERWKYRCQEIERGNLSL